MRFGSRRHSSKANIIPSYAERSGGNQAVEDASLKAAQAMFKKHSGNQVPVIQAPKPVPIRMNSSSSRQTSANVGRRSPRLTLPRSGASVENMARSVSPFGGTMMDRGESGVSDAAQQAASVALDSENNGSSGEGLLSLAIPGHVTSSDGYLSSRSSSKLSLPRQHSPLPSQSGGGLANKLHSMSLESVCTIGNSPGTSHSGSKTLAVRKDGAGVPAVLIESDGMPMSRDDTSEQDDRSLRNITHDATTKMNVPVTYKGTLPDLIPVHQRQRKKRWHTIFGGTPSSGVPGSASGGPSSGDHEQNAVGGVVSEVQFNQADENLVVKSENPMQKTKLRTTMRANNSNYTAEPENALDSSGDSSDESTFSVNSEFDKRHSMDVTGSHTDLHLFSNTGVNSKKKRRSIMRSHKRHSFNEDKPWKSHVDIGYVSEKERKRYEGIWVTNRNSYLELLPWWDENDFFDDEDHTVFPQDGLIINQVVLDLWSRSNLPPQLLAQIYDKVDTRHDGTLNRQSFLIGMWLVDQCLYGRKLPKDIDQRVWDSVEKFAINIPNNNPHHHHRRRKKMLKKELKTIKRELNI